MGAQDVSGKRNFKVEQTETVAVYCSMRLMVSEGFWGVSENVQHS